MELNNETGNSSSKRSKKKTGNYTSKGRNNTTPEDQFIIDDLYLKVMRFSNDFEISWYKFQCEEEHLKPKEKWFLTHEYKKFLINLTIQCESIVAYIKFLLPNPQILLPDDILNELYETKEYIENSIDFCDNQINEIEEYYPKLMNDFTITKEEKKQVIKRTFAAKRNRQYESGVLDAMQLAKLFHILRDNKAIPKKGNNNLAIDLAQLTEYNASNFETIYLPLIELITEKKKEELITVMEKVLIDIKALSTKKDNIL